MTTPRSTNPAVWLDAPDSAALLGVRRSTLYSYASRGQVRVRSSGGRTKQYYRPDLEALRQRAAAHSGRGPRAAEALAFGEPVLETAVSGIDRDGPYYRGQPAVDLVGSGFASACGVLWEAEGVELPRPRVPAARDLLDLRGLVLDLARADRGPCTVAVDRRRAPVLTGTLLAATGLPEDPDVDAALVLLADHGLNASTFAARVVAGTGADTWAAAEAALAALSGFRHGTASLRLLRLIEGGDAMGVLADTGGLPGFGHPMYPDGDPRAEVLLERARVRGGADVILDLVDRVAELGIAPNVDAGLLALCASLGLPFERAPLLFAAARSAGWVAHVMEQRASGTLLRPRSTYQGWRQGT